MADFKFNLGDEVKERITGFTGVVMCRTQWLYNCNVYGVKSRELKEGKPMDCQHFDEPSLDLVGAATATPKRDTGGPAMSVPQTNR